MAPCARVGASASACLGGAHALPSRRTHTIIPHIRTHTPTNAPPSERLRNSNLTERARAQRRNVRGGTTGKGSLSRAARARKSGTRNHGLLARHVPLLLHPGRRDRVDQHVGEAAEQGVRSPVQVWGCVFALSTRARLCLTTFPFTNHTIPFDTQQAPAPARHHGGRAVLASVSRTHRCSSRRRRAPPRATLTPRFSSQPLLSTPPPSHHHRWAIMYMAQMHPLVQPGNKGH